METGKWTPAFAGVASQAAWSVEFPFLNFQFLFSSFRFLHYCAWAMLWSHFWKSSGCITLKKARIL